MNLQLDYSVLNQENPRYLFYFYFLFLCVLIILLFINGGVQRLKSSIKTHPFQSYLSGFSGFF